MTSLQLIIRATVIFLYFSHFSFLTKLRKCLGMVLTKEIESFIIRYERTLLQSLLQLRGIVNV